MDGVIILATEQVASAWKFNWVTFIIVFVCVALLVFFVAWGNDILDELWIYIFMVFVSALVGVTLGFLLGLPTEYETQYKVTITQDVSMTEFYEIYEVVEQDGLIFTVKEKANE